MNVLGFLKLSPAGSHRLSDVAAYRARIRLRSLSAHRQALRVAIPAVRLDVLQAADVRAYLSFQFSLDREFFNGLAQGALFFRGKFTGALPRFDAERRQNRLCARPADSIENGKRYLKALIVRYRNSCDSQHISIE